MNQRSISLVGALVVASALGIACTATATAGPVTTGSDDIISVPQTELERASIGSSWIYAEASWIGSMHAAATGETIDISEAYWAYWSFFDQIANGVALRVSTGGNWQTANSIVKKYGIAAKRDFVASAPCDVALAALNASMTTGVLKTAAARRDRTLVRRELDRAWALTPATSAALDQAFGADVTRTFSSVESPVEAGGAFLRGQDLRVAYTAGPGRAAEPKPLSQAMTEWRQVFYADGDRRTFQQRVQKALQDEQPVIVTWFVDFNALEIKDAARLGAFNLATLNELGPGRQGGDMTVLEGFGAQPSGGALTFLRVKNAWGSARPDRPSPPGCRAIMISTSTTSMVR